jgi:hypothetical protein
MTDNYENERIRRGLAVLVEDAPLAPDFDELTTTRARPVERRAAQLSVRGLLAAAVLVSLVVGVAWIGQSGGSKSPAVEGPETTIAATTPTTSAVPTTSTLAALEPGVFPRVFLDTEGWTISYIDHIDGLASDGEFADSDMQFENGSDEAELRMASGAHADTDALVADRIAAAERLEDETVWDTDAYVIRRGGSTFVAIWESNSVVYEFVVHDTDELTFRDLLGSVTRAPEDEWIAMLPDSMVTDRAATVSEYLDDIPVPDGLDITSLQDGPVEHWYPVGAEVVGAVTCAWLDQWVVAKASGDEKAVDQAVDAMATSRDWAVLEEMSTTGEYGSVVWEYADAMAGDGTIVTGTVTTVEATYRQTFGCNG